MIEKGFKTRCYYTEYVNHMIRFYLTCPDSVQVVGKRKADIENWCAVQCVLHRMPETDRQLIIDVFKTDFFIPKAVAIYCQKTGADERTVWSTIARTASQIAKNRGLI